MKALTVVLALVLALLPAGVRAQDSAPLRPNDRLRFRAPGAGYTDRVAGTVVEIRDGELHLMLGGRNDPNAPRVAVPVTALTRVERSTGTGSRVLHGILGSFAGAGVGAAGGVLHRTIQRDLGPRPGRRHQPRTYVVETTLAGAATGLVAGALIPGERWRPLPLPVSLSAGGTAGTALGVRIGL